MDTASGEIKVICLRSKWEEDDGHRGMFVYVRATDAELQKQLKKCGSWLR